MIWFSHIRTLSSGMYSPRSIWVIWQLLWSKILLRLPPPWSKVNATQNCCKKYKTFMNSKLSNWPKPLSICTWFLQFSNLKYPVWWTWFLVYFKLEFYRLQQAEKSSSNYEKNPVNQTRYFKLENCKNQVQIDRVSERSEQFW